MIRPLEKFHSFEKENRGKVTDSLISSVNIAFLVQMHFRCIFEEKKVLALILESFQGGNNL